MSNMGDGDMVDPDDLNEEELAGSASRSASESAAAADAADATGENDVPERAGEFDEIDTLSALDFEIPEAVAAELVDEAGAEVDYSDVDVGAVLAERDDYKSIAQRVQAEFENQGLETLDLDGQPFDPEVAEAVAHEPIDGGEAVVAEVLRSGYQWKGKTLRAAMVKTKD
jgi:molecular chaperone GrpE